MEDAIPFRASVRGHRRWVSGNLVVDRAFESRLTTALRLIALVGLAEFGAIALTVAAFMGLAVGFGAAP